MSEPFLHQMNKTGGKTAAGFHDTYKTPATPYPLPLPYPTMGTTAESQSAGHKQKILSLANVVDTRAANGNIGAKIAQSQAIESVGGSAKGATEATLLGQSRMKQSAGDEPGTMSGVKSQTTNSGPFKLPAAAVTVHLKGAPVTLMGGAGMVDFTDTKVDPGFKSQDSKSGKT